MTTEEEQVLEGGAGLCITDSLPVNFNSRKDYLNLPEKDEWFNFQLHLKKKKIFHTTGMEIKPIEIAIAKIMRLKSLQKHLQKSPPQAMQKSEKDAWYRIPGPRRSHIEIELQKGQYKKPPPFKIPRDAYLVPTPCSLLGFDEKVGKAYVRFRGDEIEEQHEDLMALMRDVYMHIHPRYVLMHHSKIVKGIIVVARIPDDNDQNEEIFIRAKILKVDCIGSKVDLVNIDDQKQYLVPFPNLFSIFEYFLHSPMMSIECNLKIFVEVSTSTEYFGMIIPNLDDTGTPTIELYRTEEVSELSLSR